MKWIPIECADIQDGLYFDIWAHLPSGQQMRIVNCQYKNGEWLSSLGPIICKITHYAEIIPPNGLPQKSEEAPPNSLPDWRDCKTAVDNSEYSEKENNGHRNVGTLYANPLHEFIYEYDCADHFKSGWFMYRLEKALDFVKGEAVKSVLEQGEQDAHEIEAENEAHRI